jgi:hypothetical protein
MQVLIAIVVGAGLALFLVGIIGMSAAIIIDTLRNGLGSEAQREQRDRMMGDPKDRP